MGVSGCGKSTLGAALARRIGARFVDGDSLHPPANIARMAAGVPLDDRARAPWLDRIGIALGRARGPVVIACSALRRVYRVRIARRAGGPVIFLHLDAPAPVLRARLAARSGHFMPPALLDSQLATLERLCAGERGARLRGDRPFAATVRAAALGIATLRVS